MLEQSNRVNAAEQSDVEILGKTGQTVVYIFPSGNAKVKRGKVSSELPKAQGQGREQSASASTPKAQVASPPQPQPRFSKPSNPVALIDRLVQVGLLSAVQKEVVQYDQAATGMAVEEILSARGWFNEETMAEYLN